MIDFLLVIPTFNEERYIREIITDSDRLLSSIHKSYRIVVVDASSTDSTTKIVREMENGMRNLSILESKDNGNRGRDVLYGMHRYNARIYCYIDADLGPSISHIREMLKWRDRGYEVVLASRYTDRAVLKRPALRKAVSMAYNRMINILFGDSVMDHQCGFKMFSAKAFREIYKGSEERHWVWDTEAILLAHCKGLRMKEIPIVWEERRSNRTRIGRLISDILIFIPGIARLFYRFMIRKEF